MDCATCYNSWQGIMPAFEDISGIKWAGNLLDINLMFLLIKHVHVITVIISH
jgi:hypothetical protein